MYLVCRLCFYPITSFVRCVLTRPAQKATDFHALCQRASYLRAGRARVDFTGYVIHSFVSFCEALTLVMADNDKSGLRRYNNLHNFDIVTKAEL